MITRPFDLFSLFSLKTSTISLTRCILGVDIWIVYRCLNLNQHSARSELCCCVSCIERCGWSVHTSKGLLSSRCRDFKDLNFHGHLWLSSHALSRGRTFSLIILGRILSILSVLSRIVKASLPWAWTRDKSSGSGHYDFAFWYHPQIESCTLQQY